MHSIIFTSKIKIYFKQIQIIYKIIIICYFQSIFKFYKFLFLNKINNKNFFNNIVKIKIINIYLHIFSF